MSLRCLKYHGQLADRQSRSRGLAHDVGEGRTEFGGHPLYQLIIVLRIVVVRHATAAQVGAGHNSRPHRHRLAHAPVPRSYSHPIGKCLGQYPLAG